MLEKRFYIDMEHYCPKDGAVHGDMCFTICDMPDTMTLTLEEAIESAKQGIRIDIENGYVNEDDSVYIYTVTEYTYDTDLFEDDDKDFSPNSYAVVEKRPVYAICHPCSDNMFTEVCDAWKEPKNPCLNLVRFVDYTKDEDEPQEEPETVKEAYIVTIECRSRVVVEVPRGTSQEEIDKLAIEKAIAKIIRDSPGYLDADNCTEVEPDEECPAGTYDDD